MKCKITTFAISILCFATITVAQPQFPRIAPPAGVLNLGVLKILQEGSDGKPAKEGPSERELLCMDIVAFAFPESQSQDPLAQWGDSPDIFVQTFYPEKGLSRPDAAGSRWGLSNHAPSARLDRTRRNHWELHKTIQEQSRVLYNLCKTPLDPSR